jgi:inosose dehydratase
VSPLVERIAGAPISWGVCEVPGWGVQLPAERVLDEMRSVGLKAAEFGPEGFLPADGAERARVLRAHGLDPVGGFVPVVLHDATSDPLGVVDRELDAFVEAGAGTLVLAAATGLSGYDERPQLDAAAWRTLLTHLDRLAERAAERGVRATLHPHVGTVVERRDEVLRVLEGSSIPLCLDTGHLVIGGTDPAELAATAPERIAHTHLKDVDTAWADKVRAGQVTYTDAVRAGIYRPLGQGDVDIAGIVRRLEDAGYDGWYVMEQDTVLTSEDDAAAALADVRAGADYLRGLAG